MGLTMEIFKKGWVETALAAERSPNVYTIWEKKKKVVDYYWNHLSCIQSFTGMNEIYLQGGQFRNEKPLFFMFKCIILYKTRLLLTV